MDNYNEIKNTSAEDYTDGSINLMRNRTFNSELRELVNRIKENENSYDDINIDDLSESEVLYLLHQLFYKTKNLKNLHNINTLYNPFLKEYSSDDFRRDLEKYISEKLERELLTLYSILTYNISDKCFSSSSLNNTMNQNIIISLHDNLYGEIVKNRKGFILDNSEILKNPFIRKKFYIENSQDYSKSLFIILLGRITENIRYEIDRNIKNMPLADLLSPLLIIEFEKDLHSDCESIYNYLVSELAIPLLNLECYRSVNLTLKQYDNYEEIVDLVENFLNMALKMRHGAGVYIKSNRHYGKRNLLQLKYLKAKLTKVLPDDSIIIRIGNNKLFIICDKSYIGSINALIDDFNSVYRDYIEISTITRENIREYKSFLIKLCF